MLSRPMFSGMDMSLLVDKYKSWAYVLLLYLFFMSNKGKKLMDEHRFRKIFYKFFVRK